MIAWRCIWRRGRRQGSILQGLVEWVLNRNKRPFRRWNRTSSQDRLTSNGSGYRREGPFSFQWELGLFPRLDDMDLPLAIHVVREWFLYYFDNWGEDFGGGIAYQIPKPPSIPHDLEQALKNPNSESQAGTEYETVNHDFRISSNFSRDRKS